ncbi:MAG: hypothetical protein Ct9H300mP11_16610 [Chloroflexota bacterium]|nr:MAG: hypothetical protein Ct9H300mP11_16610 [Chloroflexota bacterium]
MSIGFSDLTRGLVIDWMGTPGRSWIISDIRCNRELRLLV